MGWTEGSAEGLDEGELTVGVNDIDGCEEGWKVGCEEGWRVGWPVGNLDGLAVGNTGAFVGIAVVGIAVLDGEAVVSFDVVGMKVGTDEVGLLLGYEDGNAEGCCAKVIWTKANTITINHSTTNILLMSHYDDFIHFTHSDTRLHLSKDKIELSANCCQL